MLKRFKNTCNKGFTLIELMLVICLAVGPAIVFGLACWTSRNLDFVLTWFKGTAVHVPFFLDLLLAILAPFTLGFNIIVEIVRCIL